MGQVQSRQGEDGYFKLDVSDKDGLIRKYTELASSAKGGKVLETTDEFFGEGFHLIRESAAIEDKNRESANGFWKDGWETKRHNKNTHHHAIIQLASPGTIAGFDVDTSFFDGSHPSYASVEACLIVEGVQEEYEWKEILPKIPLKGNSHHYYGIDGTDEVYTHIKLNMYPDGGIARLRVYGKVSPIFPEEKSVLDLASLASGGLVIKTSDDRYGKPSNLILPTAGVNTRDGWQTRRSRVKGHHDWVEVKLGAAGHLQTLEVDTTHFRGNNPDFISLDACKSEYNDVLYDPDVNWVNILSKSEVEGDKKNTYDLESKDEVYTHVRLNIFPDGGISRLRVHGIRVPEIIEQVIATVETKLIEAVDDLKVNESSTTKSTKKSTAAAAAASKAVAEESLSVTLTKTTTTTTEKITVVETEEAVKEASGNVVLTSEVSSVTTLVDNEESAEPVKKAPGKRGRPKGSAATTAALAVAKLSTGRKKKGRSASALEEDDEGSESSVTAPKTKKARE
ncbi:galactose-binding domain-like protein [Mortierella sp. GBAus27b]|nr:Allantoicase [Mortierella sp. GBA43]KAI8356382.1 galactose-binding domain-like protein [Mortierella sp. GBAus27b]